MRALNEESVRFLAIIFGNQEVIGVTEVREVKANTPLYPFTSLRHFFHH